MKHKIWINKYKRLSDRIKKSNYILFIGNKFRFKDMYILKVKDFKR